MVNAHPPTVDIRAFSAKRDAIFCRFSIFSLAPVAAVWCAKGQAIVYFSTVKSIAICDQGGYAGRLKTFGHFRM
jgi:hypothetical protein